MSEHKTQPRVVLAHDSFTQQGGAERVFEAFHQIYPDAPIYTTVVDKKYTGNIAGWNIITSPLQFIYNIYNHFQYLFPLVPFALKFLRIPPRYDVLLSSSSAFAKAIRKPQGSVHICYCHTPTRFIWTDVEHAVQEAPWVLRFFVKVYLQYLKQWDLRAVKNVDIFIANSKEVQGRIQKFYGRESVVIYPFIDTNFWRPTRSKADYFLIAGRLQPYKQNELVIEVFNELGWPLHVVGTGRQEAYLRSIAKSNITFLGRIDDALFRDEYSGARGYIYPQLEDAGINPIEAAACGTASIGLNAGGSRETIVPGVTGEWFSQGSKEELKNILERFNEAAYSVEALRTHAEKFGKTIFIESIQRVVRENSKVQN